MSFDDLPLDIQEEIVGRLDLGDWWALCRASRSTRAASGRVRWGRFDASAFADPEAAGRGVGALLAEGKLRGFRSIRAPARGDAVAAIRGEPDEVEVTEVYDASSSQRAEEALGRVAASVVSLGWEETGVIEPPADRRPPPTLGSATSLRYSGRSARSAARWVRACPSLKRLVLVQTGEPGDLDDPELRSAVSGSAIEELEVVGGYLSAGAFEGPVAAAIRSIDYGDRARGAGAPGERRAFVFLADERGIRAITRMVRLERLSVAFRDDGAGGESIPRRWLDPLLELRTLRVFVGPASGDAPSALPGIISDHARAIAPAAAEYEILYGSDGVLDELDGCEHRTRFLESVLGDLSRRGVSVRFSDYGRPVRLGLVDLARESSALLALSPGKVSLSLVYGVDAPEDAAKLRLLVDATHGRGMGAIFTVDCRASAHEDAVAAFTRRPECASFFVYE